jgi:drug/metabolite transporter (DMT)-like permease
MKLAQQAPRSITPSLHYSISHGANTHLALLQHATAHVLANSAIGSQRKSCRIRCHRSVCGMVYLLLASLLWTFSFGLIGRFLRGVDPNAVAFIRLSISLLLFLPLLRVRGMRWGRAGKLMLLGGVQYGVMYVTYIHAYRYLAGHQVAIFTIFTPLFVTLIHDRVRRRFNSAYLLAALLAVAGTAFLVWADKDIGGTLVGILLVQVANLCFALGQVGYKLLRERDDREASGPASVREDVHLFGLLYLGAVIVTGAVAGVATDWSSFSLSRTQMLVLLYLGALPSGVAFFFWNLGARRVNAGILAAFNNVKIPMAVLVSLVVFGEQASVPRLLIGGGAILGGVLFARLRARP